MALPIDQLHEALELVQSFDPVGVGAEDLRECLLIQLRRMGKAHSLEYRIVDKHLEDLARKRYPQIARKLGVEPPDISRAAESISNLNPRPGREFSSEPQHYVTPDVDVSRDGDDFVVTLNNEQIPHLRISNTYKELMAGANRSSEVKKYVRDKVRSGKFLIKSIHQRQQTIQNISEEIVRRQRDFFLSGPSRLKPMNMATVADAVGVHETTVSRAIAGKYMSTPYGVFEMKYFFSTGYQNSQRRNHGQGSGEISHRGTRGEARIPRAPTATRKSWRRCAIAASRSHAEP